LCLIGNRRAAPISTELVHTRKGSYHVQYGLWGFLLGPVFFLTYIAVFGCAFLLALRRLWILRSTTLRFATPILCTIVLLFCSFAAGSYIGDRLNSALFHMPVQDFDK
jgi:heme/copper-type cytochrome/quinol oxidase subunit 3